MEQGMSSTRNVRHGRMYIDHVSLTVCDVDRSIEFYRALGMKVLRISILGQPPKQYRNAFMHGGGFLLELLPFSGPKRQGAKRRTSAQNTLRGSLGITHLGVRVRNLDVAIERLKAAGGTMTGEPVTIARGAVNIAYFDEKADHGLHYIRKPTRKPWRTAMFLDPDGVVVELVER